MIKKDNLEISNSIGEEIYSKQPYTIQTVRQQLYGAFSLNGELCSYDKGNIIFRLKDVAHNAYIVEKGRVRIFKLTSEGREVTFGIKNKGEGIGIAEVILGGPRMRYAEAMGKDTKVWVMKKHKLLSLIEKDKELGFALTWILSKHMLKYQRIVENLATLSIQGRVIQLLVRLSEEHGRKMDDYTIIDFPLTHEEIAKMVGSSRQTITSVLNDLRDQEILNWEDKKIKIYCWDALFKQT